MNRTIEIVEGPGAGKQVRLTGPMVIGRDPAADIMLDDVQASRRHARIIPAQDGVFVEDLDSTNGTLVNANEVHGRAPLQDGDELVIGVTVLQLHTVHDSGAQPSAVRAVPPPLTAPLRRPTFTDPVTAGPKSGSGIPELDRLRDQRVRSKARLAPLAIFVLVALIVVIYLGATT
jgi:pSer/pThr/pTyr-binding forkhead associated (FHA) protein